MGHGNAFGDSQAQNIQIAIDQGSGAGKLKIYTAAFTTLLVTFTLPDPCAPTVVTNAKKIILNAITSVNASASGTANAYRLTDSADVTIYEKDDQVGVNGSGRQLIMNTTTITSGVPQNVISLEIGYD
jgi:hypothetical protein